MQYDPLKAPESAAWLALDEQERIAIIATYHRKARILLPNANIHAILHAVVENQLALGVADVVDALDRLMREGLDRHDAIHAIGSVLVEFIEGMLDAENSSQSSAQYYEALRSLTKASWYKMYE